MNGKRSAWFSVLQGLSWLTQLGLSLAVPVILPLLAASWLVQHKGWGTWAYPAALVLGLGAAACTFWQFVKMVQRKSGGKSETEKRNEDKDETTRGDAP